MVYEIISPPKILGKYVRNFWLLECDYGPNDKVLNLFSDGFPRLSFQCNDGDSYIKSEEGIYLSNSFLSGVSTKPIRFLIRNKYSHVAVSLYPQAVRRIFGIDACDVVDHYSNLSDFCPKELTDRILDSRSNIDRLQLLVDFLTSRLHVYDNTDDPVIEDCIFGQQNDWTLNGILRTHKISGRQLERKFKYSIGIPPKTYLRIMRFEKAMKLLQTNTFGKLLNIAIDLGYWDHAHFTKDFKESAGFTPKEYLASRKIVEYGGSFVED